MGVKEGIGVTISYVIMAFVAVITIISIFRGNISVIIFGVLYLFIMFLPIMLKRKWRIALPWTLNLLIAISLFLHVFGLFGNWYRLYHPFYDKFGHFIGSFTIGLLGFTSVLIIDRYTKVELTQKSIVFFVIFFTLAVGALWEIGEFTLDIALGTNSQYDGLTGTMLDLVLDFFAGIAAGGVAYFQLKRGKEKFIDKLLKIMNLKRVK